MNLPHDNSGTPDSDQVRKRREAILEAISFAAERFLKTEPWHANLPEILERLGRAAQVSRIYIFQTETDPDAPLSSEQPNHRIVHEIVFPSHKPCTAGVHLQDRQTARWLELMRRGQSIRGLAKEFPEDEKQILLSQRIRSIVTVPILVEENLWGFIGFDECVVERGWSNIEVDTLKTAANLIGAAIQREKSQAKLRESENRYKELADLLPQPVFETDLEGRLTFVNKSALQHFGYTQADLRTGLNVCDMFDSKHREQIREAMRRLLLGEGVGSTDCHALRKDGSTFPVLLEVAPLYRAGLAVGLRGILIDISKLKQMEEMLKQREQLYRMIFNHSPVGIMQFNQDGIVVACNDKFLEILGQERDAVIGVNLIESVRDDALKQVVRTSLKGQTGCFEGTYTRPTGNRSSIIRTIFSPITSEKGDFLCGLCIAEDVTDQRSSEQALRQSEARYKAIVEDQTELISRFTPDGVLTFVNDAYCRYFGEAAAQLIGNDFWHHVPAEDQKRFKKHLENLSCENQVATIEHRVYSSSGEIRWQQWTDRAILDEAGNVIEVQAVGRDITERKKVEEALLESEKQMRYLSAQILKAQEQERQRIARDLHDSIIQLLATIKINLRASLRRMNCDRYDDTRESFASIVAMVQEAIEEVRRVYTGLRPSMLDNLGILATLSWACQEFHEMHAAIRVEKRVEINEEEIPDTLKIVVYRILQEALNNIARHSRADLADISLRKENKKIVLSIRDNGCGFDLREVLSQRKLKHSLGLVSMKERTELAGGSFLIESAPQRGTTITCVWPTPT